MRLEFSFTPTKRDVRWVAARASRRAVVTLAVFSAMIVALGLIALSAGESVGALFLLYLAALVLLLALMSTRRTVRRLPAVAFLPRRYELDDDGIRITTRVSVVWYSWEILDRLVLGRGGWLLYAGRVVAGAIPRSAVPAEHRTELERMLTRVAGRAQPTSLSGPAAAQAPADGVHPASGTSSGAVRPSVPDDEGTKAG
jgi:hypothetical protein